MDYVCGILEWWETSRVYYPFTAPKKKRERMAKRVYFVGSIDFAADHLGHM
jgi:hypothetical protein